MWFRHYLDPQQNTCAPGPSGDIGSQERGEVIRARRQLLSSKADSAKIQVHNRIDQPAEHNFAITAGRQHEGRDDRNATVVGHQNAIPQESTGSTWVHSGERCCSGKIKRWFRLPSLEQMRVGVLEHLGIAQAPAWLFAAGLREGTVIRLLTAFERTAPILAVRPASRRLSTKVRIFIEYLEKTFALCSQFNPRPENSKLKSVSLK